MREQNIGRMNEVFKARTAQSKFEKNGPSSLGTAITAAALQQHLSLSLGIFYCYLSIFKILQRRNEVRICYTVVECIKKLFDRDPVLY